MSTSIFSKLTPQATKFYPLLNSLAEVLVKASTLMKEFIENYTIENAEDYNKRIKDLEREGDTISNTIFEELNVTFITPFDREDIHHLATCMDDVMDFINSASKRIYLYKPKRIPGLAVAMLDNLIEGSEVIREAILDLKSLKKKMKEVNDHCDKLHTIENIADDIYEHFLIELFENPSDGVELIKLKEIMHELEKATDALEGVGKAIKIIVVKYA